MTIRKVNTKAVGATLNTYVGKAGEIFYDTATATLKLSNGSTPGGVTLSTDGGITGASFGGPVSVVGDAAATLGSYSAISVYSVNIGNTAGHADANYSIIAIFSLSTFNIYCSLVISCRCKNNDGEGNENVRGQHLYPMDSPH